METRTSKRKTNQFKRIKPSKPRSNSDLITNQSTLVGTFLKLMEDQKAIIAVVKVFSTPNSSRIIPICFKVGDEQIPEDLVPCQIHSKNLISIEIPNCKAVSAMIVSVADDSVELFESYAQFIAENKRHGITNIETKVNDWLSFDGIKLNPLQGKGIPVTAEEDFQKILHRSASLKNNRKSTVRSSTSQASTSGEKNKIQPNTQAGEPRKKFKSSQDSPIPAINSGLEKLRSMVDAEMDTASTKLAFVEIIKILESIMLIKANQLIKIEPEVNSGFDEKGIRCIPEKDLTHQEGKVTFIEGILPLPTREYKEALGASHGRSVESTQMLNNIVRFAFPTHWLVGVTFKGTGGKKSLVSILNYTEPLADPCEGSFQNGLGEKRIRALFDHVVRKSKRVFYDKSSEQALITTISKAMHSIRCKVAPRKKSKTSKDSNDEESDDSTESNSMKKFDSFLANDEGNEADSDRSVTAPVVTLDNDNEMSASPKMKNLDLVDLEKEETDKADEDDLFGSKVRVIENTDNDETHDDPSYEDEESQEKRDFSQFQYSSTPKQSTIIEPVLNDSGINSTFSFSGVLSPLTARMGEKRSSIVEESPMKVRKMKQNPQRIDDSSSSDKLSEKEESAKKAKLEKIQQLMAELNDPNAIQSLISSNISQQNISQ